MTNENRDRDERDSDSGRGRYDTPGRPRAGENAREWSGESAGRGGPDWHGRYGEPQWGGGGRSYAGGRGDWSDRSGGFSQGGSYAGGYREAPRGPTDGGRGPSDFSGAGRRGYDRNYDETRTQGGWAGWGGDSGDMIDRPSYDAGPYGQGQYGGTTWNGAPSGGTTYARGRHSGKGPKGYQRSDERIREDVCDRLTEQGNVDAGDVEVTVESGEVTLVGTVRTRREKREIEDVCEACMGVKDVHNRIKVKDETSSSTRTPTLSAGPSSMGLPKSGKSRT